MSRILVTGVGGAAGIATVTYLKKEGHYVFGVNCLPYSPGFQMADGWTKVPYACDDAYIPMLLNLCIEHQITLVIPTVDEELIICSESKKLFMEHGIQILVSDKETLERALDKYKFARFLEERNLAVAKTWGLEQALDIQESDFPLIAKPVTGRGGRGIKVLHNRKELEELGKSSTNYILQEYVTGTEYSVDTLSDLSGRAIVAVPRKRLEVKGGVCWRGESDDNSAIIEESKKVVEALGVIGPGCLQLIYTESGEIKIFELNPRIGGTVSLSIHSGVNIVSLSVDVANNKEIKESELPMKKVVIARYFEDVFFEVE